MFKKEKIEAIIHLATNYGRNAESALEIVETNLLFPTNLFEAAIESGVNIFLNTDTSSKDNGSFYFASKKAFTLLLYCLYRKFNINVINLKLEYMYGPKDGDTKFIPLMIKSILNNNIINASLGLQKRDFVYVSDVVDAYKASLDLVNKSKDNYINLEIGRGISMSFRSFADKVEGMTNKKGNILWGKLPYRENEVFYSKANIQETQKILDWNPTHNIEQGLAKTIDWYKGKSI